AMHRICHPERLSARFTNGFQQRRQRIADLARTHPGDESESAGLTLGIELVDEFERGLGRSGGAELHTDGVSDLREVFDVRTVKIAGALTDPEEVRRGVVGSVGARIDARHGTL